MCLRRNQSYTAVSPTPQSALHRSQPCAAVGPRVGALGASVTDLHMVLQALKERAADSDSWPLVAQFEVI